MGSSCHGLAPLHLRLIEPGARTLDGRDLRAAPLPARAADAEGTLLVVVSSPAAAPRPCGCSSELRGRGVDTLGITNTADSPLARDATAVLVTRAGVEATVSCKTYLAAQAALAFVGEVLAGGDAAAAREQLAGAVPAVSELPGRLAGPRRPRWCRYCAACARSTTPDAARRTPPPPRPG